MKFTRKGYIEVLRDDIFISRHTAAEEAYESAYTHAVANGGAVYTIRYPNRELDLSSIERIVQQDTLAPSAPVLTATGSTSSVSLSWTASTDENGVTGYKLEYSTDQATWSTLYSGLLRTYLHEGLGEDVHYYRVSSFDPTGNQSSFGTASATIDLTAPTVPTLSLNVAGPSIISVTWSASTDANGVAGYTLQRSTDNATWNNTIYAGTARSYSDSGLSPDTTYYYRVWAYDAYDNASDPSFASATTQPAPVAGSIRFSDDFEGANMSSSAVLALPENLDGFYWLSNTRCGVISIDGSGNATKVWQNGVVNEPLGSGYRTISGSHALRFIYLAYGSTGNSDDWHWSENRFVLGAAQRDLWVRYWLKVPDNYIHETVDPWNAPNIKLFTVWPNQYDNAASGEPNPIVGGWPTPGGSTEFVLGGLASNGVHPGDTYASEMGIRVPDDRGRWMQLVYNMRFNSSPGAGDGYFGMWRRWEGDASFTLLAERTYNYEVPTTGNAGWYNGYLMGYNNGGFTEDTEFLVDDFTISTESLLV